MKKRASTKPDSRQIIEQLGGAAAVASLLGYGPGGTQRVHNWTKRGIPLRVLVDHPDVFGPLESVVRKAS